MDAKKFWARVRALLKEKGKSHKDLAAACGFQLHTFQGWMYKNLFPGVVDAYYIARSLDVSLEYLITGKIIKTKSEIEIVRSLLRRADEKLGAMGNAASV
jgi:transcriptional regulator with XRE-family HTH domain